VNGERLDELNRAAIQRHYRAIADHDGRIPQALLDDLRTVAEAHAVDLNREAVDRQLAKRATTRKTTTTA
jgi:hypothetical protein